MRRSFLHCSEDCGSTRNEGSSALFLLFAVVFVMVLAVVIETVVIVLVLVVVVTVVIHCNSLTNHCHRYSLCHR